MVPHKIPHFSFSWRKKNLSILGWKPLFSILWLRAGGEGDDRGWDGWTAWHHWLDGHGFGWTPGAGDGQGGLACCGSWGCKESDTTERLNWTESQVLSRRQWDYHSPSCPHHSFNLLDCWHLNDLYPWVSFWPSLNLHPPHLSISQ